jgi:hypothetical protein
MDDEIELTNLIRFAISDETDDRLVRLLRDHPDVAAALGDTPTAPIDRVLEWIFVTGLAQFERGQAH